MAFLPGYDAARSSTQATRLRVIRVVEQSDRHRVIDVRTRRHAIS